MTWPVARLGGRHCQYQRAFETKLGLGRGRIQKFSEELNESIELSAVNDGAPVWRLKCSVHRLLVP